MTELKKDEENIYLMENNDRYISLKFGTIKAWGNLSSKQQKLLQKYIDNLDRAEAGCASHKPDKNARNILCELLKDFDGEIWQDWEDRLMTNEEACRYIEEYWEE